MGEQSKIDETRPDGVMPLARITCMAGQTVCQQGTPSHQAFYIESGMVEVVIDEDGHSVKLAEIGPGEVFGEMGVLESEMRFATVKATEKSVISVMSRDELETRIARIDDPVVSALINGLSKRLRATSVSQMRYYKHLAAFQDRVAGLMNKANEGIDKAKRDDFAAEITPLLNQIEAVLDKYRK